jgi:hypothetical protein
MRVKPPFGDESLRQAIGIFLGRAAVLVRRIGSRPLIAMTVPILILPRLPPPFKVRDSLHEFRERELTRLTLPEVVEGHAEILAANRLPRHGV